MKVVLNAYDSNSSLEYYCNNYGTTFKTTEMTKFKFYLPTQKKMTLKAMKL